MQSDDTLIAACRDGDVSCFDELVRRYKDRVYNVLYRYVGNHEDALDLSQEVFVRAYRAIDRFRGGSRVYTWLYSIAANLARNRLRDRSRKGRNQGSSYEALEEASPAALASAADANDPSELAMDAEMQRMLHEALQELPETHRLAFVLRTFDDLSYAEIAETMECPVGTIKSRLNQARKMLYDRLREQAVL